MKKTTFISILLTAATAIMCLCGVFFCSTHRADNTAVSNNNPHRNPTAEFSLDKAKVYLGFCSTSYYPESLEAKLKEQGFTEFCYYELPQEDKNGNGIALGVAHNTDTLIAVFRGTYKKEWYSNFDIGEGAEHRGFSKAADFAQMKIREYSSSLPFPAHIIITGHSRGGAVANLVAARLIEEGECKSVTAYTFASPNTTASTHTKDSNYRSIFNIVNPEDFICYIPPKGWNYTKYGIILEFPKMGDEGYSEDYAKMQEAFRSITGYPHIGYPSGHNDVRNFIAACEETAPTIRDYYTEVITLHPHSVTLYEYMLKAASLLSGEFPIQNGMFLMTGSNSPRLSAMTNFIMQGVDIEKIAETQDISGSALACAHTYETYRGWLDTLNEEYFAEKTKLN